MPAVIESSVARAPSPSSSAGNRQPAGADTPSSPFSELLDSCAPVTPDAPTNPDVAPAKTEPPRADAATPGAKPDAANIPIPADPALAQVQTDLLQAIAAITAEPAGPTGKDAPVPAKVAPAGLAKDETQPDAETPAPPKDAESPDGPIVTQPAPVPATVMPPVVAVPAPAPIPVPAPAPSPAEIAVISEVATASPPIDAAVTKSAKDIKPSAAKPAGDDATAAAGKAALPASETAETASSAEDAGDELAAKPAGETPVAKPEKTAAAPMETTSPGNDTAKAALAPERQATPEAQNSEPDAADANPDVEKTPVRAANAAAKSNAADSDVPPPKDANPAASSNTPANPTLPAPAVAHSAAAHAMPPTSHRFGTSETVPIDGLAVEIAARAEAGKNHFQIRLDPPELGHIHVQLQIDGDGNVTSHLRVDRVETLDLLRREAQTLERALQDAGLKTADSGLQFSLRNQSFSQHDQGRDTQAMARIVLPDETVVPTETQRHYGRPAGVGGGVDIRV